MNAKELNIGDYVRTKEFGIKKVAYFDNGEPILENGFTALQSSGYESDTNIIRLLKKGDYINGKLVTTAEDVYTTDNIYIGKEVFVNHDELIIEEDIENIVTHEMFESIKYKVGE